MAKDKYWREGSFEFRDIYGFPEFCHEGTKQWRGTGFIPPLWEIDVNKLLRERNKLVKDD